MSKEASSPEDVKDQDASLEDVKSQENDDSSEDVKRTAKQDGKKVVKFGDYEVPETVYTQIKTNTTKEVERKLKKEWEETGRLITDEDRELLKRLKEQDSDEDDEEDSKSEKDEKKKQDERLQRELKKASDKYSKQLEALKKEAEDAKKFSVETEQKFRTYRVRDSIRDALVKNKEFNIEALEDAVRLIADDHLFEVGEDYSTVVMVDEEGQTLFDSEANPMTPDKVVNQWLANHPVYQKSNFRHGAGGQYGSSSQSKQQGPSHLREDYKPRFTTTRNARTG